MAAAEERRVDVEAGIMRGGSDQADVARLHIGQEEVLLRFVKPVDLVDEEDGALGGFVASKAQDVAHLGDIGEHGIDTHEFALGLGSDDFGQRSLAATGRAVKDEAAEVIRLNEAREEAACADDVILANYFLQTTRTHAHSQRAVPWL